MQTANIFNHRGEPFRILLADPRCQVGVMTLEPGESSGVGSVHEGSDQVAYVAEGTARAEVAGDSQLVESGMVVIVPAGAPHTFTNVGKAPLLVLSVYAPPTY